MATSGAGHQTAGWGSSKLNFCTGRIVGGLPAVRHHWVCCCRLLNPRGTAAVVSSLYLYCVQVFSGGVFQNTQRSPPLKNAPFPNLSAHFTPVIWCRKCDHPKCDEAALDTLRRPREKEKKV